MGVTFLAVGSRGDVEPMAVLAEALAAQGESVTVVAVDDYSELVRSRGLTFCGLGSAGLDGYRDSPLGGLAMRTPLAQPLVLRRWLAQLSEPLAAVLPEVVAPGSLVVTGVASRDCAVALRMAFGCRTATVLHTAVLPTVHRASHLEGRRFWGRPRLDRRFAQWYWETVCGLSRATSTRLRARLGLPRLSARASTAAADEERVLLAADPILLPPAPDWPDACVQTGAVIAAAPPDWAPPQQLASFLAAGESPVYLGLGSLNDTAGEQWTDLLLQAARQSGRRLVAPAVPGRPSTVIDGWVCTIADTPHEWLFPRLAGIVHLGGAGTTVAGLRAGVPSVALPAMFDQPYHARRLTELGVGPRSVPLHRVSAATLAGSLAELVGGGYAARAAAVGRQVRATDGTARTVAALATMV